MLPEMNAPMTAAMTYSSDEQACRLILHNLQDGYILLNSQLAVVYCNRTARERTLQCLNKEMYPGMSILELAEENRGPVLKKICYQVLEGHCHSTEIKFVNEAGQHVF